MSMLSWLLTNSRTNCIDDFVLKHVYKWEDLLIDKALQGLNLNSIKDLNNILNNLHMVIYWLKVQLQVLVWVWLVLQLVRYLHLNPSSNNKITFLLLKKLLIINPALVCMKTKCLCSVCVKTPLIYHSVNSIWIL
jgi:hypothetical protein